MPSEEIKRALIVVRTYPTPSKKGVEVSCTAAITNEGKWLRLFPVPWRLLPEDQRFRKYQWIEARVTKASDPRPESYRLRANGIKILSGPISTAKGWAARKAVIYPLRAGSLCQLKNERDSKGFPTLGIFRPRIIKRLIIEPDNQPWSPGQLEALQQGHLFQAPVRQPLEKIPHKFIYDFECDHAACGGHMLMCSDWEMSQSYRQWKGRYGAAWEGKFRQKYEAEMIREHDTHFYVGTVHQHPQAWIIVGLFYPPIETGKRGLFD